MTIEYRTSHDRDAVIASARSWLGTPYHHQASVKGIGTDCLGLIRGVWRDLYGFDPEKAPAYSRDWGEANGEETLLIAASRHLVPREREEAAAGDVLVFRMRDGAVSKHCAILTSPETMIHAVEGAPVDEVPLTRWWQRKIKAVFSFPGAID